MSQLNVDTIKKADGTGNLSVPAETGTVVTTASPSLGRRNLIINGAMQVAQRGTSATGVNGSTYYSVDRYRTSLDAGGSFTVSQDSSAPDGFATSLKILNTSGASISSYHDVRTYLEAQDLQRLQYGTSSAKTTTLSFWVKSNQTGTGAVFIQCFDVSGFYTANYTINSADTWEHKTITITGDTSGGFNNDNGAGLMITFGIGAASSLTSGNTLDTWSGTYSSTNRFANQTISIDATDDYIQFTGIQWELGSVATPFEHRSYGEELQLCRRYYISTTCANHYGYSNNYGGQDARFAFPTTMRANPTVTTSNTGGTINTSSPVDFTWNRTDVINSYTADAEL
jgi:hypothetical protein